MATTPEQALPFLSQTLETKRRTRRADHENLPPIVAGLEVAGPKDMATTITVHIKREDDSMTYVRIVWAPKVGDPEHPGFTTIVEKDVWVQLGASRPEAAKLLEAAGAMAKRRHDEVLAELSHLMV
jgi:hypothetical protein